MTLTVTPRQCAEILEWNIKAGITTMIKGKPSTAKSAVVAMLARKFNLLLIDQRVSQLEPEDMQGMPRINPQSGRSEYVPFDWIPLEDDELPTNPATGKKYDGWLLFLDELNAGEKPVTKAAYKLVLDRMSGQRKMHPRCAVVAAGNLDTDGALVEDMGTAMQSRMSYLEMAVDNEGWLDHANANHFDRRIISYIRSQPGMLFTFDPKKVSLDHNYACYRTWEFAHKQLQQIPDIDNHLALVALAGSISEGVARQFLSHCRMEDKLPKIEQIIADPLGTLIPDEPSCQHAVCGTLAHYATEHNIDPIMDYAERLPKEFCVTSMRDIGLRNQDMLSVPRFQKWYADNALELF